MRARPLRRTVRAVGLAALATVGLVLAGCAASSADDGGPRPTPSSSLPSSTDAIGVVADVYRTRVDPARGGIQLSVTNQGDAPLALDGARLDSPLLSAPLERRDEVLIPAGATLDLPMTLVDPRCPGFDARAAPAATAPSPEAVLLVPLADGSTAELRVPTTDRIGQWAAWVESACFAEAFGERVGLTVSAVGTGAGGADGTIAVELIVTALPGPVGDDGGADVVRLESVGGTVLLGALDADGDRAEGIPLSIAIDTSDPPNAPIVVPLRFSPNRCDAHAIADDKQGTLFRVGAAIGERRGIVTVVSDEATKEAVYAAITAACAADD
ncbi:hypothetical protein GCM10009792_06030 [Microcella alkalica]|uniref:Uncharacterized protein n=1 Tax=Microcella alkalica TaxID=355930 RepID=A0A839EBL7_9MICO|nr:hypothetical protein [Microcella alkalica]MBA8846725.1 hypothetical protein [Microcella alkalica]